MRDDGMTMRLVDALYAEAMALADETRGYFDARGRVEREALAPIVRVAFTCESLKITTRLMHIIAWLLTRRALAFGDIGRCAADDPSWRLARIADAGADDLDDLPDTARRLVEDSGELYRRVCRLDAALSRPASETGPARGLIARLERSL